MLVVALNVDLGHHREGHAVVLLTELPDLTRRAGLLPAELVAGETEDHELLASVLFEQGLQLLVLRRVSATACGVDDEHALALKLGEVKVLAIQGRGRQCVEILSGRHGGVSVVGSTENGALVGVECHEGTDGQQGQKQGHQSALHAVETSVERASSTTAWKHPKKRSAPREWGASGQLEKTLILHGKHPCRGLFPPV